MRDGPCQASGKIAACFMLLALLQGCAVAAIPCKVADAVTSPVPVVGGVVGTVFETCGDIID